MAKNLVLYDLVKEVPVLSGVVTGDPVVVYNTPGVALYDRDSDGNATVDFRAKVWDLSVKAVNDAGNSAVAVGNNIYYTPGDTVKLSKQASGNFFGIALEIVGTGTTDTVKVLVFGGRGDVQCVQQAKGSAVLDLSGSAVVDQVILHATQALHLVRAILLYTEASSANTGKLVTIGKETDNDYYYTGLSEVSKSAWYEAEVALLNHALAAGDTIVCGTAGGKTGTGEILVCIEYTVD